MCCYNEGLWLSMWSFESKLASKISFYIFFFFKQKTAYEMRISDWSSDVCSSDLRQGLVESGFVVDLARTGLDGHHLALTGSYDLTILDVMLPDVDEIGRASCRERVCQYV